MHYNTGGISFHLVNETTITRVFQIALRGGGGGMGNFAQWGLFYLAVGI